MRRAWPLLLLLLLAASACHESIPVEPESRPVLVLAYSGPCDRSSALVALDGVAIGRVSIPGALSLPVAPGVHRLEVGSGPAVPFEMPERRDLILTDVPSPCP